MPFVKLASLEELPPGSSLEATHDGRIYAIFHHDGQIRTIDGVCPHQGGPLADGEVENCVVTCPWHGWQFDLRDGRVLHSKKIQHQVFETKVEGNDILVCVP